MKNKNSLKDYGFHSQPGSEQLKLEDRKIRIKKDSKEILEIFGIKTEY